MRTETKRCIAYTRVSSEGQRDNHSLPTQRAGCLTFAAEQGWTVVDVAEEVYTATLLDRPRLAEVRNRIASGEAEIVLVFDQDRLARKTRQLGRLLDELDEAGAEVWSVLQGKFETDALGVFMTNARGFGAEVENEQRRERSMRAHRDRVNNGNLLGSGLKPAYGYRWPEERRPDGRLLKARLEVNEPEAEVVRRVFSSVLAGVSSYGIAKRLNNEGVPSPYAGYANYHTTGEWRHQTLRSIVENSYYTGEAWALTQRRLPKKKDQKHGRVIIDYDNGVRLPEGTVPPIVSRDDFDRANLLLSERRLQARPAVEPERVLLRGGLVRCGNCGRAMRLAKRPNGNRYYQCNKMGREAGACARPSPSIKTQYVEEPVWELVRSLLLDPYKLHDRFHSAEQTQTEATLLASTQARLLGVEQRRARLLRNLELLDESEVEDLRPRLAELAVERGRLQGQAEALGRRLRSRDGERERLERMLTWARSEVQRVDELTAEEKRAVLIDLGVVVRVFPATAPERYTVEIGAAQPAVNFFADTEWENVGLPTARHRREGEREIAEATERGHEAELIEVLVDPGSEQRGYSWDYWDEHIPEALAQHARVLKLR